MNFFSRQPRFSRLITLGVGMAMVTYAGSLAMGALVLDDSRPPGGPNKKLKEEGKKLFGPEAERTNPMRDESTESASWCIVLGTARGPDAAKIAGIALNNIQREGKLPEAYVVQRGEAWLVALGHFTAPDSDEAKSELARVRATSVQGSLPYADAFLAAPNPKAMLGNKPEFSLVAARAQHGERAKYTLQVGYYGREELAEPSEADLKESRTLAEVAAAKLRQEGEVAFYFHGPRRSMVTVGVFDETDADPAAGIQSKRLRETRERHPYNLYNGAGVRVRSGNKEAMVRSRLVGIPESESKGATEEKPEQKQDNRSFHERMRGVR
ncbi:MAG: hypothetical protein H7Y88_03690 [Phycisphaerales bacterium]|nr:hypothetical protein [Phycisphaerales bacterium]